ncbi:hypothetical protein GW17_00042581 [Ensete ventricosum]|nr:hypothetical protein GW17_00042581 [Ensete ventricosum]RZS23261.1 hypothetical protein BHM03_00056161 [Ensete ventricosum]
MEGAALTEKAAVWRGRWRRGRGHRWNSREGEEDRPPKDNDERPQEGATCGRWGGAAAVDRLLGKTWGDEGYRETSSDLERNRHWRQRVAWRMMLSWLGIRRRVDHLAGREH